MLKWHNNEIQHIGRLSEANKGTMVHKPSWSNFQIDLLGEILGRLCYSDQVRFGAVCKNWMVPYTNYQEKRAKKLPGLLRCCFRLKSSLTFECLCQCYHPWNCIPVEDFAVDSGVGENLLKLGKLSKPLMYGWRVASKHGWLFFSREKEKQKVCVTEFFLLHPFTKKIVALPDLEHGSLFKFSNVTTFSSDPNSSDCVFFVLRDSVSNKISISTFSLQNNEDQNRWITTEFVRGFNCYIQSAVYKQGIFYCISYAGNLAAYTLSSREWKVHVSSYCLVSQTLSTAVESNGDLLHVQLDAKYFTFCRILIFDWHVMDWVHKGSLMDEALFVGRNNSFSVPAVGETRNILANRIFYLGSDGNCKVYYIKDGKFLYSDEGSRFNGWNVNLLGGEYFWIEPCDHLVKHT